MKTYDRERDPVYLALKKERERNTNMPTKKFSLGEVFAAYSPAGEKEPVDPFEQELDRLQAAWMQTHFTPDPQVNAAIRQRAIELHEKLGGYLSLALFTRSYLELINEGAIQPIRQSAEQVVAAEEARSQSALSLEEYRSLPVAVAKQRYKTDLAFRAGVDLLVAQGKI